MMYISGTILSVAPKTSSFQGRPPETHAQISILNLDSNGEGSIIKLKADISNIQQWDKFKNQEIIVEVRQWKKDNNSGLMLVDKSVLPTLKPSSKTSSAVPA